ncbi:p-hydroxybenzoic acid efflux subunit AaeA [Neorhodopirellula pilleata]|uniref:p-hydroxybenzoic acid efflux subunit AaeA n=2 Tax=Neorhodopirellula pilleata TaxID=2714738 RepID=A0A5C5ZXF5_9BACT|nr:p-hydroxybenzoic acid efflux subunit AaeA [Neorhodopirellula pilleata]
MLVALCRPVGVPVWGCVVFLTISGNAWCESDAEQPEGSVRMSIADAQVVRIQDTVIASPIAGVVDEVLIREGDLVGADQTLVQINADRAAGELAAAQAAYHASLIQAENDVNTRYAQRTLDVRRREMSQSVEANQRFAGSVTATEIDRLQLVIDQAQLSVEQAEHEREVARAKVDETAAALDLAKLRVAEHQIVSRVPGRVAEASVQVGQWVDAGAPVARLVSLDPIRISAFVDGRDCDRSLVGSRAEFIWKAESDETNHSNEIRLLGKITFVSDELNPVTSQVRLWAEVANPDERVRPGMRGQLIVLPQN